MILENLHLNHVGAVQEMTGDVWGCELQSLNF